MGFILAIIKVEKHLIPKKRVARDKNLRPCLPLKPQEKRLKNIFIRIYYYEKKQHTDR